MDSRRSQDSWNLRNLSRGPSAVHFKGSFLTKVDMTYPTNGIAIMAPARTLSPRPSFKRKSRRLTSPFPFPPAGLAVSLGSCVLMEVLSLPLGQRERLSEFILSLGDQPGHDAGNFLFGHRLARNAILKIR